MKSRDLAKAWSEWKRDFRKEYQAFKNFDYGIKNKKNEIEYYEVSNIFDTDGSIDEFELRQIIPSTTYPIPVDRFMALNQ